MIHIIMLMLLAITTSAYAEGYTFDTETQYVHDPGNIFIPYDRSKKPVESKPEIIKRIQRWLAQLK